MLKDRVAWVTGATGGLGPAIVRTLAEAGARVVATAQEREALESLRAQAGFPVERWLSQPADLTDATATQATAGAALARFGRLDILVAVAGGWRGGVDVVDTDPSMLEWLWRINVLTAFNACRAALPTMVAQGWGRIITIGARAAVGGQARSAAYSASKAALLALTQSIGAETRISGVTANTILVSTIDTPANRAAMPAGDFARWVTPEQIAATVRFLCSEEAAAICGAAVPVYGRV